MLSGLRFGKIKAVFEHFGEWQGLQRPAHFYVALCDKWKCNKKMDTPVLIFAGDLGYPDPNEKQGALGKCPVMVCGNFVKIMSQLKNGHLSFNPLDYDSNDFDHCFLMVLRPKNRFRQISLPPEEFLDWQFDSEMFHYVKRDNTRRTHYISSGNRYLTNFDSSNKLNIRIPPKPALQLQKPLNSMALVPTKVKEKPIVRIIEKPPLANPSNMKIISYE